METGVTFNSQGLRLVGRFNEVSDQKGAIITHPHPLYGGDMDNAVVTALAQTYQKEGWSTLRFNFRGTGQSQGDFDNGDGEQDDIQAAIDFFQTKGLRQIHLAGYSFGAWVLASWSQQRNKPMHPLFLVSPPTAFIEFPRGPLPGLKEVFAGARDELGPPNQIQSHLNQWCPDSELTIIEKADHFYWDHLDELTHVFSQCIRKHDT